MKFDKYSPGREGMKKGEDGEKEREQDGGKGLAPIEMMKSRRGAYGSGYTS